MAIHGKFEVNGAKFSPLTISGLGTFLAFSGNKQYRNKGGCVGVLNNGPLPPGKYWIVERPKGGLWTWLRNKVKEIPTWVTSTPTHYDRWFALYRDDGRIDDYTWVNAVERGHFRLHPIGPMGVSEGCITLQHPKDFAGIRNALLHTPKERIPGTDLMAYGTIELHAYGKTCP